MRRKRKVTGPTIGAKAREFIGTPYLHAGRNRYGVDCAGLLALVAEDLGVETYDDRNYSRHVNAERLRGILDKTLRTLTDSEETDLGDVLLFEVQGSAQHMGIVSGKDEWGNWLFCHAFETVGRVVEHPLRLVWAEHLVARLRWRAI